MALSTEYPLANCHLQADSGLQGRHVAFLGSSVTNGAAAHDVSFVDYLAAETGLQVTKEAVDGTTLAGNGPETYWARLQAKLDPQQMFAAFVCQLSTNDASQQLPLGTAGVADQQTVFGALTLIKAYVARTWHCPFLVYTNPKFANPTYEKMVQQLLAWQRQDGTFTVLDFWHDEALNEADRTHDNLMADAIHPTQRGYHDLWTPRFKTALVDLIK